MRPENNSLTLPNSGGDDPKNKRQSIWGRSNTHDGKGYGRGEKTFARFSTNNQKREDFMRAPRANALILSVVLTLVFVPGFISYGYAETTPSKTVKIAVLSSLTGVMAAGYKDISQSVKPTEKFLNQKGGIKIGGQHYGIQLVLFDDQSSPSGSVAAANKVAQDNIRFMLAPMFTPSNLAIARVTEPAKIIRLQGTTSGVEQYGPQNRYAFASSFTMNSIPAIYEYLSKTYPQVKKLARLLPDDPATKHFSEYDVKEAQKRGFEIVFNEPFKIGIEDFYPLLTKALEKKPDAIDMGFSILPWASGLINQARELGFKGPIFAPAFVGDIHLLRGILDPKAAYDVFQGGPDVLSLKMTPLVKEFREVVEKELGVTFNMDHTILLEGAWPLLQVIQKAQSLDPDKIVETWEKTQTIDSIYGKSRMGGQAMIGNNHILMRPTLISRIVSKDKDIEFDYYPSKDY
jgi:branched-chain amino acid transport system substrate-binding protein